MKRLHKDARRKGWRQTENSIFVGKPTKWDTPFRVIEIPNNRPLNDLFRRWQVYSTIDFSEYLKHNEFLTRNDAARASVDTFEKMLVDGKIPTYGKNWRKKLEELRGHDLLCYCVPDEPCHADALVKLANE